MKALFITFSFFFSLWAEIGPEDLTYMTENYPPQNYINEFGLVQGISVTLLKEMWKEMDCPEQEIHVYPWARAYINIQTKKDSVSLRWHTQRHGIRFLSG